MRFVSIVLVCLGLSLVACDGPGGGGGRVDCNANPTAPACQQQDTSVANDSATSTTATDGSTNNTATSPADATSGECSGNARRCDGNQPQQCVATSWQDVTACSVGQVCVSGSCINETEDCCLGMECGTDCGVSCGTCSGNTECEGGECVTSTCSPQCGGRQCGDDGCGGSCGTCGPTNSCNASGQCVPNVCTPQCTNKECGNDGCGDTCGSCAGNETCQSNQCVPGNTTGADCSATIDCLFSASGCVRFEDETLFDQCADACLAAASETGASEFNAVYTCEVECDGDLICIAESCGFEEAQCLFDDTGSAGCFDIFTCGGSCANGDSSCIEACYENSTATAQGAALGLNICLNEICPDGSSDTCVDDAVAAECANVYNDCAGN